MKKLMIVFLMPLMLNTLMAETRTCAFTKYEDNNSTSVYTKEPMNYVFKIEEDVVMVTYKTEPHTLVRDAVFDSVDNEGQAYNAYREVGKKGIFRIYTDVSIVKMMGQDVVVTLECVSK